MQPGSGSGSGSRSVVMTVVVRGKGDVDAFLEKLWQNWRAKIWEADVDEGRSDNSGVGTSVGPGPGSSSSSGFSGFDSTGMRVVGVAGILKREQEKWESTDKSMQEAFQDLNALMVKYSVLS